MTEETVKCPECMSRNLKRDDVRGEISCIDCGLVLHEDIVDVGAEWRVFGDTGKGIDRERTGPKMTPLLSDKGLSTEISPMNRDYSGAALQMNRSQLYRMRKWQRRARMSDVKQRNLAVALQEISRMCNQLGVPKSVSEHSATIYRRALESQTCRGRSISSVVAASVYLGCRDCNVPRTLNEVCDHARGVGRKEIGRTARLLMRILRLKMARPTPQSFTPRLCSLLGVPINVETQTNEYLKMLSERKLDDGKAPMSLTAACLYIAAIKQGHRRTQKEISNAANITEVTLRNRYRDIINMLQIPWDN